MKIKSMWIAIVIMTIVLAGTAGCKDRQNGKTAVENETTSSASNDLEGKKEAEDEVSTEEAEEDAKLSSQTVTGDDSVEVIEGELDDTSILEEDFSDIE